MEEFGPAPPARFDGISNAVRKKRTQASRRPRPDSQPYAEINDDSPMSSTPPSDDANKASSDDNVGCDLNSNGKEFNVNQCVSMVSPSAGVEGDKLHKRDVKDGGFNSYYTNEPGRSGLNGKRSSEGVLAPANWKSSNTIKDGVESESKGADVFESKGADVFSGWNGESSNSRQSGVPSDGFGNENKVKKVKLKVGGVTRTIQPNSAPNGVSGVAEFSSKNSQFSEASRLRHKHSIQANYDDNGSSLDKRSGLQGIPWKDFSRGGFSLGRDESVMGKVSRKNTSGKEEEKSEPVRKSKRVPKRRVLDEEFGDDEDDEIRYLEKLKTSKVASVYKEDDEEFGRKHRKLSMVSNVENVGASRSGKDGKKKSRTDRVSGDTDYEEESASDGELDGKKKRKKQRKESIDSLMDNRREPTLTTRQRALQSSKDASSTPGAGGFIEFPNGLPPAPSRKQKEKLTDVEQQLKKAEAAQRRRMQVEKAARESEAEAIRKILGQDSNRKKREDKIKKRQEELAQEKAANALLNASNTIRWVMGPSGTVVTFSKDMGLPSIFNSKPCSYPPPRENCAGPSCNNPYKYRDSKSKLPLCSLQCYKAVQAKMLSETTC